MPGTESRLRWSLLVPCTAITSPSNGASTSCPKDGNPSGRRIGAQNGSRARGEAPSGSWVMSRA